MDILQSVKDALTENPDFKTKLVEELQSFDKDLVITTNEKNQEHIKNQVQLSVQDEVNKAIKNLHEKSEQSVSELLGKQKPDNIKGYEWYSEEIKALLAEKKSLSDQIKGITSTDDVSKQRIEALEKQLNDTIELVKQKENDNLTFIKKSKLMNELSTLKFNDKIPSELLELKKEKIIADLMAESHLEGDALLFKDSEGKVKFNPSNASNPYTAKELIAESMKDYLAVDNNAQGLNGKPNVQGSTNTSVSVYVASKAPSNQSEALDVLTEYMSTKGYGQTHPEFIKASSEIFEKYPE